MQGVHWLVATGSPGDKIETIPPVPASSERQASIITFPHSVGKLVFLASFPTVYDTQFGQDTPNAASYPSTLDLCLHSPTTNTTFPSPEAPFGIVCESVVSVERIVFLGSEFLSLINFVGFKCSNTFPDVFPNHSPHHFIDDRNEGFASDRIGYIDLG